MSTYNKQDPVEDEHGYDNLCKYSIEKCELCDMVFSSRFANIIHSSQHIIIPLIKHNIHKCKKCLYCFTSKSELKAHKQAKHKKKDVNEDNDGQIDSEESQTCHEGSQFDLEGSQNGQEISQIDHEGSQNGQEISQFGQDKSEISHKESLTIKKVISKKKSQSSYNESQSDHKESQNIQNKSQIETDDLLRSIITKQPIVKIDNIVNIVAKTLLANQNDKKHTKIQKDTKILEKDNSKVQKEKKNKEKDIAKAQKVTENNEKERLNTIIVNKEKTPPEIIFSRPETSQDNIKKENPNKILIGGKKPIKRTSTDNTDCSISKKDKKLTRPVIKNSEKDKNAKTKVTNGVNTTDLTKEDENRYKFTYREISPDVISIKSDSSDAPSSDSLLIPTIQSKRSLFSFTYEQDDIENDQSKTVQKKGQSKTVPKKDQSKTVQQKDQPLNIPFVITESDDELEANIDELLSLNNVSPVKKSNFRSKIQFEDDENIKLLDLELSSLSYEFKSVHYDDLTEPEMIECRRCHMIFMNRLALYKHETTHMRFRRTRRHYFCKYCENYFYGNHFTQKKHYEQVHNTTVDKKKVFSCPVCKLQYHKLMTHYKKYHQNLICKDCNTCFGSEKVFKEHNCTKNQPELNKFIDSKHTQYNYDLLLVCDLCLSFTKTTGNFKYEVIGEKCEIGARQRCFYCTKEFFEVKIVKRINYMMAIKMQNLKNGEGKKKTPGSNAAKLYMIQKRLKAMKK